MERFHTSTGVQLAVDRYGQGSEHLVVLSHGIFGSKSLLEIQALAERLAPRWDVLALDCRGHGASSGRFSFGRYEWQDLAELVQAQRGQYTKILGIGFSFGAFHTCVAAARAQCFDAVMLVSGPKDFWILDHNPFHGMVDNLKYATQRKHRRARLDPLQGFGWRVMPIHCIGDLRVPVHIVHGDRDWLIHPKHAQALYESAPQPKQLTILEGGVHAEYLIQQMPERFLPLVEGWLEGVCAAVG